MTAHGILIAVAGTLMAVGALLTTYRIVRGPTILDRMIASDVLLTTAMLVLGTVMVADGRTDLLPVLLVLAGAAAFATIAVARSVSKYDRPEDEPTRPDPLATVTDAVSVLERARLDVEALDDDLLDRDDLRPTDGGSR